MRILHIGTEKTWRGGENQIRLLVEGLNQRQAAQSWIAYPQGSQGLKRFAELGPVVALPSSSSADPRSVFLLAAAVKAHGIQLLDAHSSGAHSLALWVKALHPELKLVVHRRVDNRLKPRWSTRRKYLTPAVDHFVAISRFIGRMLGDFGVAAQKVSVVRSAVDPLPYQTLERKLCGEKWRHRLQIPDQTLLLGSASALSSQKGPDVLLQALSQLGRISSSAPSRPWHCLIAGEGEMRPQLEQMVRELKLSSQVTLTGFVREIPELLSALDILLLPSRNEGLGTLVQEAMLAGTPVIASAVGGIPEMVHSGETGLLVPPEDPSALAQAIQKMRGEEKLRGQLVAAARQLINTDFSLNSMVEGNLAIYRSLLTASPAGD